mgnify:CR=1 FL=1
MSNGGAAFNAGKGLSNENQKAAIAGSIAGAKHVHHMAEAYGVPVIFDKYYFNELANLNDDEGAKHIIAKYASYVKSINHDVQFEDIDTLFLSNICFNSSLFINAISSIIIVVILSLICLSCNV